MIDIETEVFTTVANVVRAVYPDIFMAGEYVKSPPSFPCVSLMEVDNQIYRHSRDTSNIENHVQVYYEVNVYSNLRRGKKAECKKIMGIIDTELERLGFTRTLLTPVPNEQDATIYRMVGRYRAIVSKNKVIYRR